MSFRHIIAVLIFQCLGFFTFLNAQTGVSIGKGNEKAHPNAILELFSTNKGLLIPRMTSAERIAIFSGEEDSDHNGLLCFDINVNSFFYWQNDKWIAVKTDGMLIGNTLPEYTSVSLSTIFYNTTDNTIYVRTETGWMVTDNKIDEIQNLKQVLDKGNSAGMIKIANLLDPIDIQDAATKIYVDNKLTEVSGSETVIRPADGSVTVTGKGTEAEPYSISLGDVIDYSAADVDYDDLVSSLGASNVQDAIDQLKKIIDDNSDSQGLKLDIDNNLEIDNGNSVNLSFLLDNTDDQIAEEVSIENSIRLAAYTNVSEALLGIENLINSLADNQNASELNYIDVDPVLNATNVQTAIDEINSILDSKIIDLISENVLFSPLAGEFNSSVTNVYQAIQFIRAATLKPHTHNISDIIYDDRYTNLGATSLSEALEQLKYIVENRRFISSEISYDNTNTQDDPALGTDIKIATTQLRDYFDKTTSISGEDISISSTSIDSENVQDAVDEIMEKHNQALEFLMSNTISYTNSNYTASITNINEGISQIYTNLSKAIPTKLKTNHILVGGTSSHFLEVKDARSMPTNAEAQSILNDVLNYDDTNHPLIQIDYNTGIKIKKFEDAPAGIGLKANKYIIDQELCFDNFVYAARVHSGSNIDYLRPADFDSRLLYFDANGVNYKTRDEVENEITDIYDIIDPSLGAPKDASVFIGENKLYANDDIKRDFVIRVDNLDENGESIDGDFTKYFFRDTKDGVKILMTKNEEPEETSARLDFRCATKPILFSNWIHLINDHPREFSIARSDKTQKKCHSYKKESNCPEVSMHGLEIILFNSVGNPDNRHIVVPNYTYIYYPKKLRVNF
ncbi:MAG: hypothetical protein N4A49_16980 [Marinifilaceae bacterium]|jgi:hypothetical protein|nr:hypothetical protein [Marinifilaceae bacterium]